VTDAALLVDRPTVLVVEDDDAIRRMVADVMRAEGFEAVEAPDGAVAVEHLRNLLPSLIVLDAMLPGVHGFEICRALKSSTTHADVPVLMISAIYRGIDHARAIQEQHGADAFIEKPFHLLHLRNTAASLLKLPLTPAQLPPENKREIDAAMRAYQGYAMVQDWQHAHQAVERWLAADPFDGRAWLERGHMAMRFERPDQALPSYEVAALYLPRDIPAQGALAMVYQQMGFTRKARMTWEKLWQLPLDNATRALVQQHLQALR
jgi:CheY-like chemotaxis protein